MNHVVHARAAATNTATNTYIAQESNVLKSTLEDEKCVLDQHVNCTSAYYNDMSRQAVCAVFKCAIFEGNSVRVDFNVSGQGAQMPALSQLQYENLIRKVDKYPYEDPLSFVENYEDIYSVFGIGTKIEQALKFSFN